MKKVLLPALVIFFTIFLIYPVGNLLGGAFFVEEVTAEGTHTVFTLEYFKLIFSNPFYRECFTNSLIIAQSPSRWPMPSCAIISPARAS